MNQDTTRDQHLQESKSGRARHQAQSIASSIVVLLLASITVVHLSGCGGAPDGGRRSSSTADSRPVGPESITDAKGPSETESEEPAGASHGEDRPAGLEKLVGRWQRADGDYVLEIVSIDDNGDTQAAYYNPRPIHVAKAHAAQDGDTIQMFVELRDEGYPGCLYQLAYHPQEDRLAGVYFQAAQQQQYEVVFVRAE